MARCSTVSFGVRSTMEVVETSVPIARRRGWDGYARRSWRRDGPVAGRLLDDWGWPWHAYLAGRLRLCEPGCCWLPAGEG
jgi:hypothetical protein